MAIDYGDRRSWGAADVALYLLGVAGLAASLTVLFLGMRAVLDIGGYCAEGGPYVIDVHCPDGVALIMPLSIFAGLGSVALVGWKGAALGGRYAGLALLAWPALFLSLGWNFLEYAFFPPQPAAGIVWGWLVPGILFVLMGAFPLLALMPSRSVTRPGGARSRTRSDFAAEGEARYANQLRRVRGRLLGGLVRRAQQQATVGGSAQSSAGTAVEEDADLVSNLERLSALYRAGSLTYDEFQRAKASLLDGGGG